MENESLNGLAKGTSLENLVGMLALCEARGTMMYQTLARLALEQGLPDVAERFTEAASQEARHAGFFAELKGTYPQDFWGLVRGLQKAEAAGENALKQLAERFRAEGLGAAAAELEVFAAQEAHHGVMLQELLDQYGQNAENAGQKVYVCAVCGFEYTGDLDAEADDYVCPVCGMAKKAFRLKEEPAAATAEQPAAIEIKAVKFYADGFMTQPFALGGEDGVDKFDASVRYRSCLQNYVIDTGKEVILVDTGLPAGFPSPEPTKDTTIYLGRPIKDYMDALADLGYQPDQVSKILITHKHADHTGALKNFPNAKIYVNQEECGADELKDLPNIVPVAFTDGPYFNFPECQKIASGVTYIKAKGHTQGNSIVIVESDGLFYMIHGDVTYTDEALYANKLSVVFEDKAAARETLDRVRDFVTHHPTVYLSTHTPLGYENLEAKRVVDLANPPEVIPPGEIVFKTTSGKYICSVCGYVYDPEAGDPDSGIPAGTAFEDLPADWECPRCGQPKDMFNPA